MRGTELSVSYSKVDNTPVSFVISFDTENKYAKENMAVVMTGFCSAFAQKSESKAVSILQYLISNLEEEEGLGNRCELEKDRCCR